ncbi:MAG: GNAT family N-acetyltransferase [Pseudomonadota bacterium]
MASAPELHTAILSLNNRFAAETSPLDRPNLLAMLDNAVLAQACLMPDLGLTGFLIAFGPDASYQSSNYRWFRMRGGRFAYIDRVVVAPGAMRRGVARTLYAALTDAARAVSLKEVTCEVNLDPPNPASDAFHAALGFGEVGRVTHSEKTVRYLACPIPVLAAKARVSE